MFTVFVFIDMWSSHLPWKRSTILLHADQRGTFIRLEEIFLGNIVNAAILLSELIVSMCYMYLFGAVSVRPVLT